MDDKNRVLQIKTELNDLKTKQSRLEGQFDVVKKTMLDKYKISDITVFIAERDKISIKLEKIKNEMDELLAQTEQQLGLDNV